MGHSYVTNDLGLTMFRFLTSHNRNILIISNSYIIRNGNKYMVIDTEIYVSSVYMGIDTKIYTSSVYSRIYGDIYDNIHVIRIFPYIWL